MSLRLAGSEEGAMLKPILTVGMVAFPLMACTGGQQPKIARVSVLGDGTILLDGSDTDLAGVEAELGRLKRVKGEVWYYRENPRSEPSPEAMAVLRLVVENALPVSMSTTADFSDYVDGQGTSRPRRPSFGGRQEAALHEAAAIPGLATEDAKAVLRPREGTGPPDGLDQGAVGGAGQVHPAEPVSTHDEHSARRHEGTKRKRSPTVASARNR